MKTRGQETGEGYCHEFLTLCEAVCDAMLGGDTDFKASAKQTKGRQRGKANKQMENEKKGETENRRQKKPTRHPSAQPSLGTSLNRNDLNILPNKRLRWSD